MRPAATRRYRAILSTQIHSNTPVPPNNPPQNLQKPNKSPIFTPSFFNRKDTAIMKTKHLLFGLVLATVGIGTPALQARNVVRPKITYAVSKQDVHYGPLWIDAIEFGAKQTTVTMHYTRANGQANLMPSTTLVCHLKGRKTRVLTLQRTSGISMTHRHFTNLNRGEVFHAYFSILPANDVRRIRSIDLLEDPSSAPLNSQQAFSITKVKINKKNQLIK